MLKTYDGVSLWCNYSRQLYRVIMWLKKKYLPSKKSFNVETINFTEKKKGLRLLYWVSAILRENSWSGKARFQVHFCSDTGHRMDSSHRTGHRKFLRPHDVFNVLSRCLHADFYLSFFLIEVWPNFTQIADIQYCGSWFLKVIFH